MVTSITNLRAKPTDKFVGEINLMYTRKLHSVLCLDGSEVAMNFYFLILWGESMWSAIQKKCNISVVFRGDS